MKKDKRTQDAKGILRQRRANKWAVACENCYRKQYCQFVLTTDNCILFRPEEKTDVNIITEQ